jgi:hypothetical protein
MTAADPHSWPAFAGALAMYRGGLFAFFLRLTARRGQLAAENEG